MSGDKRTVHTDALATLGTGPLSDEEKRDAIHIAVEPTIARERLRPGQHVSVDGDSKEPHVGIVDPFLKHTVLPGTRFWLLVYPREIKSLRHVWTHPAFPAPFDGLPNFTKEESETWLRNHCESWGGPDFEDTMNIIKGVPSEDYQGRIDGDTFYVYGRDAHGSISREFWDHVENFLGRRLDERPEYFSCSC